MATAAERIVEFLAAQGIDRAFCVPGESYIALLDALHAHNSLDLVTCRSRRRRRLHGGRRCQADRHARAWCWSPAAPAPAMPPSPCIPPSRMRCR